MNMAESASLSQACVRAAQISAGTPLTTRITVICCHSCEKRQNPKRCTGRTEFLRLTAAEDALGGAGPWVGETTEEILQVMQEFRRDDGREPPRL
jgi:hypothetical protein